MRVLIVVKASGQLDCVLSPTEGNKSTILFYVHRPMTQEMKHIET